MHELSPVPTPQDQAFILMAATPSIGGKTLRKIQNSLTKFQISWVDFLAHNSSYWENWGLGRAQSEQLKAFRRCYSPHAYYQTLQAQHIQAILPHHQYYPALLKETPDMPLCLFVRGELQNLALSSANAVVGVVGTRRMTEYGKFVTAKITAELCQLGVVIVSGFMYGVDLTAHRTALERGGQTVGVLGYGFGSLSQLTYLSPQWIQDYLSKGGVLVTEYSPETPPAKGTFVQRNRIIAGMSHATVVTEAGLKSGSLHTAACAIEYNRVVCAVPGSIRSQFSQGTQELINQGATLVSSGYQILQEFDASIQRVPGSDPSNQVGPKVPSFLSERQKQIYQLILGDQLSTDQLSHCLQISTVETNIELTQLEIFGCVKRVGPRWSLA